MRIFLAIYVFAIIAAVSILGFRGSVSTKPPLEVFPDMDRQARYKPQAENEFFADGRNDRPVPAGTVARGDYFNHVEVFSSDFEDTRLGDAVFNQGKNADGSWVETIPLEVSYELIQQGQEKYDIFCSACHGAAGDGNGVTKPYGVLAANYHDDRLREAEDGYIFDVITNGKGLMLPFNDRITPEERWAIVLYVRALQLSQNANAEELTAVQRTELGF
ncbi:cytochrome c [Coraliomargarita sp. SDUM461004]|uniref:Cytochrome c n=1 Tax=Thalassobacterium sedimentorum TaxID=3041258 RepID=A0ABU1AH98_9BACT|nr:cytochrome c [Coraliomargarita sp. SDUM461004]MDQ8194195.1 cytochrome c [Coraliomargarita sp. SDUM461004]